LGIFVARLLNGWMLFLSPNQNCESTEGNGLHIMGMQARYAIHPSYKTHCMIFIFTFSKTHKKTPSGFFWHSMLTILRLDHPKTSLKSFGDF